MAREEVINKTIDAEGNVVSESNKLLSLLVPYTFNGELHPSATGLQAKANANGDNLYITGLYLKENAGAAENFQIFDGTVAAGTKMVDIEVAANGEPNFKSLLHNNNAIGPFTSVDGIYVFTADTSDMSLIISFKKIVKQATRSE